MGESEVDRVETKVLQKGKMVVVRLDLMHK